MGFNSAFKALNTMEPGYNDIGLCDTSCAAPDICCGRPMNYSLLTITLYFSFIMTQYSVPCMALYPISAVYCYTGHCCVSKVLPVIISCRPSL